MPIYKILNKKIRRGYEPSPALQKLEEVEWGWGRDYARANLLQPTILPSASLTGSAVISKSSVLRPCAFAACAVIIDTIRYVSISGAGKSSVVPKLIVTSSIPLTLPTVFCTWLALAIPSDRKVAIVSPFSPIILTAWGVKFLIIDVFIKTPPKINLTRSFFARWSNSVFMANTQLFHLTHLAQRTSSKLLMLRCFIICRLDN